MKKPIAVIITDTHLKEENAEINRSIFKQAIRLAIELGLDRVYHGGDVFHSRKGQVIPNLSMFEQILDDFHMSNVLLEGIPGNHDKTNYQSAESFLMPFKYHPAFMLHETPKVVMNQEGGLAIAMMPFFDEDMYKDNFSFSGFGKRNVLITHIGVNGAAMNNGIVIETSINADFFKRFDKVLIGHYHDPQRINDRIEYIGASLQHNFGERPNKGATILYDDLSTELHEFKFPRYLAYEIDASELTLKDIKELEAEKKQSGDFLRVVLTGSKADIDGVDKQRLQTVGINVTTKQDAIMRETVEESVVAFTDVSILSSFSEFCKKNELNEKEGVKYLNKALV